jgi:DNA-binding MarR family transcriptional regulator
VEQHASKQNSLLVLVEANPGIAQVDLARELAQDKATIVGLIDALQKRHWLVRRKSKVDQRRHGIFLTAAGHHGLVALRRAILAHQQSFSRLFTQDEMTMLIALLRRIGL